MSGFSHPSSKPSFSAVLGQQNPGCGTGFPDPSAFFLKHGKIYRGWEEDRIMFLHRKTPQPDSLIGELAASGDSY